MEDRKTSPPASRRGLFTLITLAIPLIFFLVIEGVLRFVGYGPDISLFSTVRIHGTAYHVMNPEIRWRYFPTTDFHPSTAPEFFRIPKPPGTYRIFCLGGSTTIGFPYGTNGSFPSFLRERLEAVFPDRRIEVINLGMTATNSFTVLDITRDLDGAAPDLLVVYDGHNEFYGALGVASRESVGRSRWITEFYLRAIHFKTFLLLRDLYTRLRAGLSPEPEVRETGTMMERLARGQEVPLNSVLYREGVSTFRENLRALAGEGARLGVPIILGTQVSNVRDLSPFASGDPPGVTVAARQEFETALQQAFSQIAEGAPLKALASFRRLLPEDSLYARLHYGMAVALDSLGRCREAYAEYLRARDCDRLRFRASGDLNRAILACAVDSSVRPPVAAADIEAAFASASPDSIPGRTLILEHLHPNLRGSFLIAKEYARIMKERGVIVPAAEWAQRDTIPDAVLWAARHITPIDERIADRKIQILTSGWPFTDHVPLVPPIASTDTLGLIAEEVTRNRSDLREAHLRALSWYAADRDSDAMDREYRVLIALDPTDVQTRLSYAHLLRFRAKPEEMRQQLLASLELAPTLLAHRALADIDRLQGRYDDAVGHYRAVLAFSQTDRERSEHSFLLGMTFALNGRRDSARLWMEHAVSLDPGNRQAGEALKHLGH